MSKWEAELETDPDRDFILTGIKEGFHIVDPDCDIRSSEVQNHKSALDPGARSEVEELIKKEIHKGNYILCSQKPAKISAIGAVPKSDGGYRLIHDCSLPVGECVNAYAPEMDKYSYESVDSAARLVKPGYYMAKIDIKSAYRHIPIHPRSQRVTGLRWTFSDGADVCLYDAKLPFGARAAPTVFHRISQSVKRMMTRKGFDLIVAYQDDFLVIAQTYEACLEAWLALINLLLQLGFELNYKKLVAPTTRLVFLGIQFDTGSCELALPQEKLEDIVEVTGSFLRKSRATKRQLQSLAGKLNFAAKVVRGGRTFLRRILDSIKQLRRPHHKVRIAKAAKQDIEWWYTFLCEFNGVVRFRDEENIVPILTDACNTAGGGFCNGDFEYVRWEVDMPEVVSLPINYKEAVSAAWAVLRWAPSLPNTALVVYTDNQCTAAIINKCSSKSTIVMKLIRHMFWTVSKVNCTVRAMYMPGEKHVIADTVSRLHEPGQWLHLEALLIEWWSCHCGVYNAFQYYNMCNHMTLAALGCILDQVLEWQRLRRRWTGTSCGTGRQPMPSPRRQCIAHS